MVASWLRAHPGAPNPASVAFPIIWYPQAVYSQSTLGASCSAWYFVHGVPPNLDMNEAAIMSHRHASIIKIANIPPAMMSRDEMRGCLDCLVASPHANPQSKHVINV